MPYAAVRRLATTAGGSEVTLVRGEDGTLYARKTVRPDAGDRPDLRRRIEWEGELLARIGGTHHVIGCAGRTESPPALLLEYAPGGSLADRLAGETPLAPDARRTVFAQLLDAVAHVHAAGMVHRDLKPSNVLFAADGSLRLIDFGVSARVGSRGTLGASWEEDDVGTLAYSAPEQLLHPATATHPAADVYSLGVLLYEMASGRLPFELEPGDDEARLRARILVGSPVPLRERAPGIDPGLEEIVSAALRSNPDARILDVGELGRALAALPG
ncbi:MAG TPA: serine/threonine-protein kinase [Longimicrobium sp.]|nr:serine/threonine-protein kinase [Longimicrobium sp.]